MTLPAMWIRNNMLGPASPSCSFNERTLTEAEMKVQRSLQKLSIPEWYLNKSSRPPKILTNGSPIELRPAPWKERRVDKKIVSSTPVKSSNNSTVNRNGLLETDFGCPENSQTFFTVKPIRKFEKIERSPLPKKRLDTSTKTRSHDKKKTSRSRLTNVSRTYPRISPSRKIQNINIVFPQLPIDSVSQAIDIDDNEISLMDMTKDSLEVTPAPSIIDEEDDENDDDAEPMAVIATNDVTIGNITPKISRLPNQRLTYIKPWKSPITRAHKIGNSIADFSGKIGNEFASSLVPQVADAAILEEQTIDPESKSIVPCALESVRQRSIIVPRTSRPQFLKIRSNDDDDDELCDACKADPTRRISPTPDSPSHNDFQPKKSLFPIDEKTAVTPKLRKITKSPEIAPSPTIAFLTSTKKSSELRNIVKIKETPRNGGKSLVQEIIEELNDKCKNSEQPSYVTRGSKKFVKKLVRALEKGETQCPKVINDNENLEKIGCDRLSICTEIAEDDEETEVTSENGSEDDAKSAAISTSISYKDTDSNNSSDSEFRSTNNCKQNGDYDWNMNVSKNMNETITMRDAKTTIERTKQNGDDDDDEESVYWIPIAKTKLARTSSLLSMISRLSTNSPRQLLSPCVSPIRQNYDPRKHQLSNNAWGMTYKTSDYVRTLRRIEETTILDSGYSDRSRGHCSLSSDCTWYDDMDANQTNGSDILSCNSFSHGSYHRRFANQFVARPFVI